MAEAKRRNAAAPRAQRRPAGTQLDRRELGERLRAAPQTRAARIAQQNQQAENLLDLAKRALTAKNHNLARLYLQGVVSIAPDSPAAKQAKQMLRNVDR